MHFLQKHFDAENPTQVALFNELSLWASHFGHLMLDNIPMRKRMTVLDVGFGLGFPLLEIAQRMGRQSQIYGIDPWKPAVDIARSKAEKLKLSNVKIHLGDAGEMPFEEKFFDLIVSNVGVNNFANAPQVVSECYRVLKRPGRICLTSNLQGTFTEFYGAFRQALKELGQSDLIEKLNEQERHRSTDESIRDLLEEAKFSVLKVKKSSFNYRFVDGTSMLNHFLIYAGFLPAWREIIPKEHEEAVFSALEEKLNKLAEWEGELRLSVPCLYVEAVK